MDTRRFGASNRRARDWSWAAAPPSTALAARVQISDLSFNLQLQQPSLLCQFDSLFTLACLASRKSRYVALHLVFFQLASCQFEGLPSTFAGGKVAVETGVPLWGVTKYDFYHVCPVPDVRTEREGWPVVVYSRG